MGVRVTFNSPGPEEQEERENARSDRSSRGLFINKIVASPKGIYLGKSENPMKSQADFAFFGKTIFTATSFGCTVSHDVTLNPHP
jgi:hypothetical protein